MKTAIDAIIAAFLDRRGLSCSEQEAADLLAAMVTSPDDLARFLALGEVEDDEILPYIGMVLALRNSGRMAETANANASLGAVVGRMVMRAADAIIARELTDPRHVEAARQRAQVNANADEVTR